MFKHVFGKDHCGFMDNNEYPLNDGYCFMYDWAEDDYMMTDMIKSTKLDNGKKWCDYYYSNGLNY